MVTTQMEGGRDDDDDDDDKEELRLDVRRSGSFGLSINKIATLSLSSTPAPVWRLISLLITHSNLAALKNMAHPSSLSPERCW